jgi:hypothetical protein
MMDRPESSTALPDPTDETRPDGAGRRILLIDRRNASRPDSLLSETRMIFRLFVAVGQFQLGNRVQLGKRAVASCFLLAGLLVAIGCSPATASEPVFADDFESGISRWQMLDPQTWTHRFRDSSHVIEITARKSAYQPPVRSPHHVALVKDLQLGSFEMTFRVKSTKDTGNHRDCCVFLNYVDDQHFYYIHLGARPDPHSGQIMIVNEAPRRALTDNEKRTPWDDQWHSVKVVRDAESGRIAVYFDDMKTPHMEVTDRTFVNGRIGLGSFDDLNAFDDVVIVAR